VCQTLYPNSMEVTMEEVPVCICGRVMSYYSDNCDACKVKEGRYTPPQDEEPCKGCWECYPDDDLD